jgi:hypothetical protein
MKARPTIIFLVLLAAWAATARAEPAAADYSFTALYNSANAYARAGRPGLAVLDYERARLLAPGDPDVEANLRVVRRMAGLPVEPRHWLDRTAGAVDPWLVSWLGVLGVALVLAGASVGRRRPPYRGLRTAAALLGCALIGLTVANAATVWPRLHEAIVIVGNAPVRVAPAPMSETLFTLKEAEAVRMSGEHEGFVLVRSAAGRSGWVWHTDVAAVAPAWAGQ